MNKLKLILLFCKKFWFIFLIILGYIIMLFVKRKRVKLTIDNNIQQDDIVSTKFIVKLRAKKDKVNNEIKLMGRSKLSDSINSDYD